MEEIPLISVVMAVIVALTMPFAKPGRSLADITIRHNGAEGMH
jgi:hypothetical protein